MISGERLPFMAHRHVEHCSSHLSQLMLCGADIALEPTRTARNQAGHHVHVLHGEGVIHECKDSGQVIQFVQDNFHIWEDKAAHFQGENDIE